MPYTDVGVATNSANVVMPPEVSQEIWAKTLPESLALSVFPQEELPPGGAVVQTVTGEPEAAFVDEGAWQPMSKHTFGKREWRGYKLALNEPITEEMRNDRKALTQFLISRLPKALARAIDRAVLHGTGAPGSMGHLGGSATLQVTADDLYQKLIAARAAVATAPDSRANGAWFSYPGETLLLSALDSNKRPLFAQSTNSADLGTVGSAGGLPVRIHEHVHADGPPKVVGLVGDWRKARIGLVQQMTFRISGNAMFNQDGTIAHHGEQADVFTAMLRVRFGAIVEEPGAFVKLTTA